MTSRIQRTALMLNSANEMMIMIKSFKIVVHLIFFSLICRRVSIDGGKANSIKKPKVPHIAAIKEIRGTATAKK